MDDSIDYEAVVAQLQEENERLRERLTDTLKGSPVSDAIDGLVLIVKQSDPMRLYVWVCIACIVVTTLIQVLEVILK